MNQKCFWRLPTIEQRVQAISTRGQPSTRPNAPKHTLFGGILVSVSEFSVTRLTPSLESGKSSPPAPDRHHRILPVLSKSKALDPSVTRVTPPCDLSNV